MVEDARVHDQYRSVAYISSSPCPPGSQVGGHIGGIWQAVIEGTSRTPSNARRKQAIRTGWVHFPASLHCNWSTGIFPEILYLLGLFRPMNSRNPRSFNFWRPREIKMVFERSELGISRAFRTCFVSRMAPALNFSLIARAIWTKKVSKKPSTMFEASTRSTCSMIVALRGGFINLLLRWSGQMARQMLYSGT